ncbi:tRNA (adenosine(37)-N6)-dimethylallyltransferase MiaA [Clostridium sp. 'deep sea']|uniref:tRNA (adenosine(37)-N6)-dimethylallyltransferase MiaA n=1 Tax=Clostridium sp. 'deep sea' TaxID=2779445 RepID=UPI001A9B6B48|nr:tRNA (adenosine(37)-N6)-dimethylallyltransferase MiaA [Clostridium sp. 'deep sea']
MNKVIVIIGPTAVGKTSLSIELAKQLNGEIISADSMQVFKHLNIGTAKASLKERDGIVHHMLDIVEPTDSFSVAEYQRIAYEKIENIHDRGKTPIIVGGTGLYINALVYGYNFKDKKIDPLLRENLNIAADKYGNEMLLKELAYYQPEAAKRLAVNDRKRIIRALEVYLQTGDRINTGQENKINSKYQFFVFGLHMDRDLLVDRINRRVDIMMNEGLIEEVRQLYANNLLGPVAVQALGYKEVIDYFKGKTSYHEMVNVIKLETRKYAKRQRTWFRRNKEITWLEVHENSQVSNLVDKIIKQLAGILIL